MKGPEENPLAMETSEQVFSPSPVEAVEQAPQTNREIMMKEADKETADKIGSIKANALSSLVFSLNK
jgi:hypothetical protein